MSSPLLGRNNAGAMGFPTVPMAGAGMWSLGVTRLQLHGLGCWWLRLLVGNPIYFTRFITSHGGLLAGFLWSINRYRIPLKYVFCFFPIYRMIQRQRNNIVVSIIFEETHGLPFFHTHVPEISKNRVIFDWRSFFELGLYAMEAPSSKKSLDPLCHAWSWVDRKNEAMHGSFCLWKIPWKFLDPNHVLAKCCNNRLFFLFGNRPFAVPKTFRWCCWISMNSFPILLIVLSELDHISPSSK